METESLRVPVGIELYGLDDVGRARWWSALSRRMFYERRLFDVTRLTNNFLQKTLMFLLFFFLFFPLGYDFSTEIIIFLLFFFAFFVCESWTDFVTIFTTIESLCFYEGVGIWRHGSKSSRGNEYVFRNLFIMHAPKLFHARNAELSSASYERRLRISRRLPVRGTGWSIRGIIRGRPVLKLSGRILVSSCLSTTWLPRSAKNRQPSIDVAFVLGLRSSKERERETTKLEIIKSERMLKMPRMNISLCCFIYVNRR